jgi:hypothetical protein
MSLGPKKTDPAFFFFVRFAAAAPLLLWTPPICFCLWN